MFHTRSPPSRRPLRCPSLLSLAVALFALCFGEVRAQQKTAADYFVHSLPGAPDPLLKMWAGHIEVTPEHHGNIFFWLYQNKHLANRPRTVLWLNGGPGCSSMDGALMEIGPYRIREDQSLYYNDGAWNEFANLLFVDQPVGTGFSYADGDSLLHELDEMAGQMITFLEKFFDIFPEYMHDDLYIAGESYAGQHIPYIARAISDRNKDKSEHDQWNLSGLLIGNGWISGPEQYKSYIPFAVEEGILKEGSNAYQKAKQQEEKCIQALEAGAKDHVDSPACELIMHGLNRDLLGSGECYNVYDVRLTDQYPACGMNWPPDLKQMTPYLRRQDVLQALHINPDKNTGWTECSGQVSGAFTARNSPPAVGLLPGLLEEMQIILFSGDKDLICNHIGTENLISNLEWNGGKGMEISPGMTAPKQDWTFDGEPAGQWQTAGNLTYIRFYNSSHMVPFDYPKRTKDMLNRFIDVQVRGLGPPVDGKDSLLGDDEDKSCIGPECPNSVAEKDRLLEEASWAAYRRSGEAALVVVLIAASAWGYFILRERRRRGGYKGVLSLDPYDDGGGMGLDGTRRRSKEIRDIEAAAHFDESELDDMSGRRERGRDRFGLADDDDEDGDEGDVQHGRTNGRPV